jgi:hypothetical protein
VLSVTLASKAKVSPARALLLALSRALHTLT